MSSLYQSMIAVCEQSITPLADALGSRSTLSLFAMASLPLAVYDHRLFHAGIYLSPLFTGHRQRFCPLAGWISRSSTANS